MSRPEITSPTPVDQVDQPTRLRALFSSAIGSAVEWYDYFLYGTMAGIIFGPLFFPSTDPAVSLALSFASFALAFVVPKEDQTVTIESVRDFLRERNMVNWKIPKDVFVETELPRSPTGKILKR